MRKTLCLFMVLLLLSLSVGTASAAAYGAASAASTGTSDPSLYSTRVLSDDTVAITLYTGSERSVVIPSEIDGRRVTVIGNAAFSSNTSVTAVVIPDGVEAIERYAFENCDSLRAVTIPSSVISIGNFAFAYCECLRDVTMSTGLESIGASAFYYCESLRDLAIPDSVYAIGGSAFYDTAWYDAAVAAATTSNVIYAGRVAYAYVGPRSYGSASAEASPAVITLDDYTVGIAGSAFCWTDIESVTIPEGVRYIGDYAFGNCRRLKKATIPSTLTVLGSRIFEECVLLSSVSLPDSLTAIGARAFYKNTCLTTLLIPESVTEIDATAFLRCDDLTITGYQDSYAMQYAAAYDIPFVNLGKTGRPAPTVRVSVVDGHPVVSWNAVDGALLYRVFVRVDNGWRTLADTTDTSFVDLTALLGGTYTYTVRCISADRSVYTGDYDRVGKTVTVYEMLLGDANMDGEVTITDATRMMRYVCELIDGEMIDSDAADVDRDGEVTIFDATHLQRYLAELINEI